MNESMAPVELREYLKSVITARLEIELGNKEQELPTFQVRDGDSSLFARFIREHHLSSEEVILLLLGLIPHLDPGFFQSVISPYFPQGGEFPEFGGAKGKNYRGILPTGETALFVLAGNNLDKRVDAFRYFEEGHLFFDKNILTVGATEEYQPKMSGLLLLDEEYVQRFTTGKILRPKLGTDFPAERIQTGLGWSELVLAQKTREGIQEIERWLQHNELLMDTWNLRGKVKPGFRTLFYGPAGTGKTLTACLLGKHTNRDVYRIDLSMVVSKYIGETEKNLSKLFDKATNKDWILFFDEADSIFGKRTNVRDAHDKYANQEVSYLLQRIEMHPGLVILASNMKSNIDPSFTRRFNAMIEFDLPDTKERWQLWKTYLPSHLKVEDQIDLGEVARKYQLTGANILNIIQFAGLKTVEKGENTLSYDDLLQGIRKEYEKEGKLLRQE